MSKINWKSLKLTVIEVEMFCFLPLLKESAIALFLSAPNFRIWKILSILFQIVSDTIIIIFSNDVFSWNDLTVDWFVFD